MLSLLSKIFVWWKDATPGTYVTTWFSGTPVGNDQFGNRYYQSKDGKRRWVIYAGTVEASRVPADWHGWLHHTFATPPTQEPLKVKSWEAAYSPNLTGTPDAYRPEGSLWKDGKRPAEIGRAHV